MALSEKTKKSMQIALGYKDRGDEVSNKIDEVDGRVSATVAAIADPGTATAEDVANKVNEVIAALKAAGLML